MKKEKKNVENKASGVLDTIAAVCFFISAFLGFSSNKSTAIMNICLGGCFIGLATMNYKKYAEANKDEKDSNK